MTRLSALLLLAALTLSGCGGSKGSPTAPVTPDNPDPPHITCTVTWQPTPSTIHLTSDEAFVVTLLWVSVSNINSGAGQLVTDLPSGYTLPAHVQIDTQITGYAGSGNPYSPQQGDGRVIQVRGHRPGQSKAFNVEVYRD